MSLLSLIKPKQTSYKLPTLKQLTNQAFDLGNAEKRNPSNWKHSLRFLEENRKHYGIDKIRRAYEFGKLGHSATDTVSTLTK
jgi:hypothetical protein